MLQYVLYFELFVFIQINRYLLINICQHSIYLCYVLKLSFIILYFLP